MRSTSDPLSTQVVRIGEVVKIGVDLKAKLELLARRENGDATWLARRVLREYVESVRPTSDLKCQQL